MRISYIMGHTKMHKRVLVTGGCGFIGSNFINWYLSKYPEVHIYNIDCLNYCAKEGNVLPHPMYKFIKGNINDVSLVDFVLNEYQIDTVIHFAAQSHVDNSFDTSLQYTIDNVLGTHTLLDCAKRYGKLSLFLHFSTDEVYGEVDIDNDGCCEKSLLNPTNPYAATKAGAEFIVRSYHTSFKLPTIIIRCNNVYGPNQYPEKLIPRFIKMMKEGKSLPIHGKGETRRNFVYTDDVSNAVDIILTKGTIGEIYNIGTTNEYSVMDIATMIIHRVTGKPIDKVDIDKYITYVPDRPFNDFRYMVKNDKLRSLGWIDTNNFTQRLYELCDK